MSFVSRSQKLKDANGFREKSQTHNDDFPKFNLQTAPARTLTIQFVIV